jgi:hypothetical protein
MLVYLAGIPRCLMDNACAQIMARCVASSILLVVVGGLVLRDG